MPPQGVVRTPSRQRPLTLLQERFVRSGLEGLNNREVVELLLGVCPWGKGEELTKRCLQAFKNIRELMSASPLELQQAGFDGRCLFCIKLMREIPAEILKQRILDKPVYKSSKEIFDYLYYSMKG